MVFAEPRVLTGGRRGQPGLPLVTVDLDGVLCEPPLGFNLTTHGAVMSEDKPKPAGRLKRWAWRTEAIRYFGRRRMPGADTFLRRLAPHCRLYLLTARGLPSARHTRGWLEHNGLWRFLDGLVFRVGPELPPYTFKAEAVAALQPVWHIDDDGRTAMHIASRSGRPVVLIGWPGNEGTYPEGIVRVAGLAEGASYLLRQIDGHSGSASSSSVPANEAAKSS
jgi:hypothetical protein